MENKEGSKFPTGMPRRVKESVFERDIMMPGMGVEDAITMTYFRDDADLITSCLYLAFLEDMGIEDGKRQALYAINGKKAINYRAVKYGVQAHAEIYWDSDASKEDKKQFAKIQEKNRRNGDDNEE